MCVKFILQVSALQYTTTITRLAVCKMSTGTIYACQNAVYNQSTMEHCGPQCNAPTR